MTLRLVFDQHVSRPALDVLRTRGVDVVHVADVGLASADDAVLLQWARREGRIVVTRNYRDFAPLVEVLAARGEASPGVLFLATSVRQSDVGAHVRTLEAWLAQAAASGAQSVAGGFAWLR